MKPLFGHPVSKSWLRPWVVHPLFFKFNNSNDFLGILCCGVSFWHSTGDQWKSFYMPPTFQVEKVQYLFLIWMLAYLRTIISFVQFPTYLILQLTFSHWSGHVSITNENWFHIFWVKMNYFRTCLVNSIVCLIYSRYLLSIVISSQCYCFMSFIYKTIQNI